jgi:programmed cell death 6-interacting protein
MNILFNLAALYSQLAISSNRSNTEGLKTAASYFSQAAGVLKHMKTEVLPELRMANPPDDMDEATLESLTQLLLAQSQECFWQKAVMDGYKDASIAKLAARVSDLYNLAGEAAMRSEAISSAWIHHMSAKHHHFAAAAQYRAACDCLEKKRYGEEVARLTDAVACVKEGLKECRGGYINQAVVDDLQGLKRRVEEDLKRAEKDNDIIYLREYPPCLPPLSHADSQQRWSHQNPSSRSWIVPTWPSLVSHHKSPTLTSIWEIMPSLGPPCSPSWFPSPSMWPYPSTKSGETGSSITTSSPSSRP